MSDTPALAKLRRTLPPRALQGIPAPLGFLSPQESGSCQHDVGPDLSSIDSYALLIEVKRCPSMPGHFDATAHVAPAAEDIGRIWRTERRLGAGTTIVYLTRIQQFRTYCALNGLVEREELTFERVGRFIDWYAERRGLDPSSLRLSRTALLSLNRAYHRLGLAPPDWRPPRPEKAPPTPFLARYAAYLLRKLAIERCVDWRTGRTGKLWAGKASASPRIVS